MTSSGPSWLPAHGAAGKERGARDIRFVSLLASAPGIERLRGLHPDVPIWTAAVDEELDENGFLLPGLGDAGDRAYGTK